MMFTGTTQQQDTRFSDKEKKLLKQMKFGDCLNKRVDMSKVKLDVLRPWISKKITDILHIEDDVVVEFVYNQLEEEKFPCPKKMQINMTGFLNGRNARQFMGELWALLLSAQESETGIPAEFLQQKKEEILKREEELKQAIKHDRSLSRDRDRLNDHDRRSGRGRSNELTQREREQQLPASTMSAIEQVRSQLSAKSKCSSDEDTNLGGGNKVAPSDNSIANTNTAKGNKERSKSPNSKSANTESNKHRIRSPRRRSRDRSPGRGNSRHRYSPPRNRNSQRDKSDRRRSSPSPRRRSPDRRRQRTRSRDRGGRPRFSSRRRSRSGSLQKHVEPPNVRNRRSAERKSKSISPNIRKPILKGEAGGPSRNKRSPSRHSNAGTAVNGHEDQSLKKPVEAKRGKDRSRSRSRSNDSQLSAAKREKPVMSRPRSRSLSRKPMQAESPRRSPRSSSRSSVGSGSPRQQSVPRTLSRNTSISLSPENRKDDFEIRRNQNSVQRKRHYRNNRGSSASSVERENFRRQPDNRRNNQPNRRFSPRGRSPRNEGGGGRLQRSRSRRRSRSRNQSRSRNRSRSLQRRSRSRNRSRSPMRRSRSPRRFNRRRSPMQHFRGRGANNRGRMNNWRRSQSRGRGAGRFERRFSPQRRFSRERRSPPMQNQFRNSRERRSPPMGGPMRNSRERRMSPMQNQFRNSRDHRVSPGQNQFKNSRERRTSPMQNQFRKFSPQNRFSPQFNSQPRLREQPLGRDRRPSSPMRGSMSRERGGSRWDQSAKNIQRQKPRSSSESSNWDDNVRGNMPGPKRRSPSARISPVRNNGRRDRSLSFSQDRQNLDSSPVATKKMREFSADYSGNAKMIDLSRNEKMEVRKSKPDLAEDLPSKKQKTVAEPKRTVLRDNYSSSLSRTPSPFLKPHEREKAQKSAANALAAAFKKAQEASKQRVSKESDSSSSESSGESDDSEEEQTQKSKRDTGKKRLPKKNATSSSENESEGESGEEKARKKGHPKPAAKTDASASLSKQNISRDVMQDSKHTERSEFSDKRKNATELRDSNENPKKLKLEETAVPIKKRTHRDELQKKPEPSGDSQEEQDKVEDSRTKPESSRKRVQSKQRRNVSESEEEQVSKKKRKKNKRSAKRNSDDDSSSDSDAEQSLKKKKHKKHKKHSKKSKKHKKHKKKSKKAESTSSSEDNNETHARDITASKLTTASMLLGGGVNEDLEKQLRERALKSMKKAE